jgi:hypothetical protein
MENVYKYLGAERSAFLENGLLRFTQAAALNDPYECLAAFPDSSPQELAAEVFSRVLEHVGYKASDSEEERLKKSREIGEAFNRIKRVMIDEPWRYRDFTLDLNHRRINEGLGILSLSRRWDSALMWSHYTKTYSGFCVGFRRDHDFFKEITDFDGPRRTALLPVKYRRDRTIMAKRLPDNSGLDVFVTKSVDWAYEEEDRLLAMLQDANKIIEAKPYNLHLFKVPFEAISEVIVGHNAPESLRIDVVEVGKKLGIPVYRTQLSARSFDVDRSILKGGICF